MCDLSKMFEDGRFKRYGLRKYFSEIDGKKIGVVLATKSNGYDTCALNKTEFDDALRAKHEGRIDEAYIVAAKAANGAMTYWDQIDAEQLSAKLVNMTMKAGRYGDFFVLPPGVGFPTSDPDEPF
jgi:hypothetical protein